MGLVGLLKLCGYEKDHPAPLTLKEMFFIWYAGLIRGAIAFGLVLRIDGSFPNRDVIVTTCLSLVVVTTIFFGSTVGLLGAFLFKNPNALVEEDECALSVNSSVAESFHHMQHPNMDDDLTANDDYKRAPEMQVEAVVGHDKDGKAIRKTLSLSKRNRKGGCTKYIQTFDENIMKPIFIYKYNRKYEKQAEDFFNMYLEQGNSLEKMYKKAVDDDKTSKKERILDGNPLAGSVGASSVSDRRRSEMPVVTNRLSVN